MQNSLEMVGVEMAAAKWYAARDLKTIPGNQCSGVGENMKSVAAGSNHKFNKRAATQQWTFACSW